MKLRNKKTGEIGYLLAGKTSCNYFVTNDEWDRCGVYNSLAEVNSEWEDAPEEPKEHWAIDQFGEPINVTGLSRLQLEKLRQCGNDFETEEEVEKAVEKLKAWKRLKDKGFRFEGWDNTDRSTIHNFSLFVAIEDLENINRDLDLLFSGEDD